MWRTQDEFVTSMGINEIDHVPRLKSAWPPQGVAQASHTLPHIRSTGEPALRKQIQIQHPARDFCICDQLPGGADCWSRDYTFSSESLMLTFAQHETGARGWFLRA